MVFDILNYLEEIEVKLAKMGIKKRLVFSLWCYEELKSKFAKYLYTKIDAEAQEAIEVLTNSLWTFILCDTKVDGRKISIANEKIQKIDWDEGTVEEDNELENYGAVQMLECITRLFEVFQTESSRSSAESAECIINFLDFEIQNQYDYEEPLEHPFIKEELSRQKRFLSLLNDSDGFDESIRKIYRN